MLASGIDPTTAELTFNSAAGSSGLPEINGGGLQGYMYPYNGSGSQTFFIAALWPTGMTEDNISYTEDGQGPFTFSWTNTGTKDVSNTLTPMGWFNQSIGFSTLEPLTLTVTDANGSTNS